MSLRISERMVTPRICEWEDRLDVCLSNRAVHYVTVPFRVSEMVYALTFQLNKTERA